ncbi:MAG: hypothetical protein GY795_00905, partial [Desulfobacterales bacterium]|nr:hypothetical protein [Desulfobacterales bacterium]
MEQHYGLIHLWQLYEKGLIKEDFISCAWYFASYKVFRYGNALMKNKPLWKEVICKILGWDSRLDQYVNRTVYPSLDIRCYYLRKHGMPLENAQLALLGGVIWDGAGLHDKIICGWPAQTDVEPEDDQTHTDREATKHNIHLWLDSKENRSWNYTTIPNRRDFPNPSPCIIYDFTQKDLSGNILALWNYAPAGTTQNISLQEKEKEKMEEVLTKLGSKGY